MRDFKTNCAIAAMSVGFTLAAGTAIADDNTALGTDVGSRLVLAYDVNDDAAAAWLPEGTKLAQVGRGPFKGADLLFVMNDWTLRADTDGKPLDTSGDRVVVVAGFGIPEGADKPRLYVMRFYASDPNADPYKVTVPAMIAHANAREVAAEGAAVHTERWTVMPETGGSLTVELNYEAGTPAWSSGTSTPYSVSEPDLHMVYNWNQLAEVAMSAAMGKPLAGEVSVTTDIEELAPAFDGSEELIAIISVPTYYRDKFAPGS